MATQNNGSDNHGDVQQPPEPKLKKFADKSSKVGRVILRVLHTITGQYIPPIRGKSRNKSILWSLLWTIYYVIVSWVILLPVNLFPTITLLYAVAVCPIRHFDVCYNVLLYGKNANGTSILSRLIILIQQPSSDIFYDLYDYDTLTVNSHAAGEHSLQNFSNYLYKFENFSNSVFIVSSLSSSVSYLLFIIALRRYVWEHVKNIRKANNKWSLGHSFKKFWRKKMGLDYEREPDHIIKPLHPFDDDDMPNKLFKTKYSTDGIVRPQQPLEKGKGDGQVLKEDDSTTTQMQWRVVPSYVGMLLLTLGLVAVVLGLFIRYGYGSVHDKKYELINESKKLFKSTKIEIWEYVMLAFFMYSLFCTLSSCFIFSKIAYGIQQKCAYIAEYLHDIDTKTITELNTYVNLPAPDVQPRHGGDIQGQNAVNDKIKLHYLQKRMNHFIKVARATLEPFELWFIVHWVLYIISTFFTLNLFTEAILYKIDTYLPFPVTNKGFAFTDEEIILLAMYCASNLLFFVYPCLRAAAITDSKQALIHTINKRSMMLKNVSPELKNKFITYINDENFGFRLQIMCIKIKFSYSAAYVSIFVGMFGVLFKVATSF